MNALFPNEIIVETKHFIVAQNWEVPIAGFFILSSKRPIRAIDDLTAEEASEYISLVQSVRKAMRTSLGINEVYFFQNEDTQHNFHLWFFPRHAWMEKFGRKIESVKPIIEFAKENLADENNILLVKESVRKTASLFTS